MNYEMYNINIQELKTAGKDFKYLLNRNYPRQNSLCLIGNRYNLDTKEREILNRAIHSQKESLIRKNKKVKIKQLINSSIGIDGHNVIITLESVLKNIPVVECDDGVIRDIAGVSSNYRITDYTYKAISFLTNFFINNPLKKINFFFDSPISHSGKLANKTEENFKNCNLPCQAKAVKVPEKHLTKFDIVSTSDSILIDESEKFFDLAGYIIKKYKFPVVNLK